MKKFIVIALAFVQTFTYGQAPTITSPIPGQVFYEGEKVEIRWQSTRPGAWNIVSIAAHTPGGNWKWITGSTPNNGSYDWTAEVVMGSEKFALEITDGGFAENKSRVAIEVRAGSRPVTVTPKVVPVSIVLAVAVRWTATPGETYRMERWNGEAWETTLQQLIDFEECYVEQSLVSKSTYRITNITQSKEVVHSVVPLSKVLWSATPGHTYRVKWSADLTTWETAAEGTVDFVDCQFQNYAEGIGFYQVLDLTPN